jgi:CheY-like chemotaxis protein
VNLFFLSLMFEIVSNKIVTLHGGRIGVHSDGVGHGSTFYIDLPLISDNSSVYNMSPMSHLPEAFDNSRNSPIVKKKPVARANPQPFTSRVRSIDSTQTSTSFLRFVRSSFAFAADSFGSSQSTRSVYVDPACCELTLMENGEVDMQHNHPHGTAGFKPAHRVSVSQPDMDLGDSFRYSAMTAEDNASIGQSNKAFINQPEVDDEFEIMAAVQRTSLAVTSPVEKLYQQRKKEAFMRGFYVQPPLPDDDGEENTNIEAAIDTESSQTVNPVTEAVVTTITNEFSAVAADPIINCNLPGKLNEKDTSCYNSTSMSFSSPISTISVDPGVFSPISELDSTLPSPQSIFRILKDKRVLIVDDSVSNRKVVNRMLRDKLRHRLEARDGKEACDLVSCSLTDPRKTIDIIILDFYMPIMDGPEAARRLRSMGYNGIIIGVTGNGNESDVELFRQSGVNEILMKPLHMDKFWSILIGKCMVSLHLHSVSIILTFVVFWLS